MSSSIQYAIQQSRRFSHPGYVVIDEPPKNLGGICFGIIFSAIYIGVASYFYTELASLDKSVGGNCSLIDKTNLDPNVQHYCQHAISWKVCAILGIGPAGVVYLLFGCVTLCVLNNAATESRMTCQNLWGAYDFLATLVVVAIFITLLSSDVHGLNVKNAASFHTAALTLLVVVGIEAAVWMFAIAFALICGFCAWCVLFFE